MKNPEKIAKIRLAQNERNEVRISNTLGYAIRSLLVIGAKGKKSAKSLAKQESMPERFLLQILKKCVSAKILHSERGANGGYMLAKPLSEISVLDVIKAIDGPVEMQVPIDMPPKIADALKKLIEPSVKNLRNTLQNTKLSDLTN